MEDRISKLEHRIEQLEFVVKFQADWIQILENKLNDLYGSTELEWDVIGD